MPSEPAKREKRMHPGDPAEVHEPKNVRPPSEPTPAREPPVNEIEGRDATSAREPPVHEADEEE